MNTTTSTPITNWFAASGNWGVSLQTLNGDQCISIEVGEPAPFRGRQRRGFEWRLAEREDLALMSPQDAQDLARLLLEVSSKTFVQE